MVVKDIKNNTVCVIKEDTGETIVKYKGLKTKIVLAIGLSYEIERNATTTVICRKSQTKYVIKSYIK